MRRHPAEVTSDRLGDHYERWRDRLTGKERDAISMVRAALESIAEEDAAAASVSVEETPQCPTET